MQFRLPLLLSLITLCVAALTPPADFATPLSTHSTRAFASGSWAYGDVWNTDEFNLTFTFTPPNTSEIAPTAIILQIFQNQFVLFDGPIQSSSTEIQALTLDRRSIQRLKRELPIEYIISISTNMSPSAAKLDENAKITTCFELTPQPNQPQLLTAPTPLHSFCADHIVTASAIYPMNVAEQLHFRAYCNGQAPGRENLPITLQTEQIAPPSPEPQPPCENPQRFHIFASNIRKPSPTHFTTLNNDTPRKENTNPTLTFEIFGNAKITTQSGTFNPDLITCRVNTHFVNFVRHDYHDADADFPGKRQFFPAGRAIYVAYAVSDLTDGSVLEIECDKVGLHYDVYESKDVPVQVVKYDTGVLVTIADEDQFGRLEDVSQYAARPSFSIFFDQPDLPSPFDLDTHATINMAQKPDEFTPLQLFGRFYLTGKPHVKDYLKICPNNVQFKDLSVLVIQKSFSTSSSQPLPLFEGSIKAQQGDGCYKVNIFEQHPWRVNVTTTPQSFPFYFTTDASNYKPGSSVISTYVSHFTTDTDIPRSIFAGTPLPYATRALAESMQYTKPVYTAEIADQHSMYSAKLSKLAIAKPASDFSRITLSVSSFHTFDGDIQCRFTYTSVDGDQIDDTFSPRIDKSIQDATLLAFDLESAISSTQTAEIGLDCTGLFVVSSSYDAFKSTSILQLSGLASGKWYFMTNTAFSIDDAHLAPKPFIPVDPADGDDDDGDDEPKKSKVLTVIIVCGLVLGAVALVGLLAFVYTKKYRPGSSSSNQETLINSDGYDGDFARFE